MVDTWMVFCDVIGIICLTRLPIVSELFLTDSGAS